MCDSRSTYILKKFSNAWDVYTKEPYQVTSCIFKETKPAKILNQLKTVYRIKIPHKTLIGSFLECANFCHLSIIFQKVFVAAHFNVINARVWIAILNSSSLLLKAYILRAQWSHKTQIFLAISRKSIWQVSFIISFKNLWVYVMWNSFDFISSIYSRWVHFQDISLCEDLQQNTGISLGDPPTFLINLLIK